MTTAQIGNLGEALTTAEFIRAGVPVYLPVGDGSTADLVAEFGGRPQRIQVKTTIESGDCIKFRLRHKTGCGNLPYADGSLDYYALVSLYHNRVCLIPFNPSAASASIRYCGVAQHTCGPRTARAADEVELVRVVERLNTAKR